MDYDPRMASEANIQKKIIAAVRARGGWIVKAHQGGYGSRGTPDLLGVYSGHMLAIEVKAPGGKATAHQINNLHQIRDAGGIALIIDDPKILETYLDAIDAGLAVVCPLPEQQVTQIA